MWRMFSCLRCCPRPKLRMTVDSTIPSLQRSSVPSNIRKKISSSFKFLFKYCFLLKFKTFWSNPCWDASSYSPTAPKLLISWRSCLWPGRWWVSSALGASKQKTNLYPGAFSPQQHRDHSEERARKYCETTRIETERENDNWHLIHVSGTCYT